VAGVEDWQQAAPDGQRVVAAAPLRPRWQRTRYRRDAVPWGLLAWMGLGATGIGHTSRLVLAGVLFAIQVAWVRERHRLHQRPEGMAAWVTGWRAGLPVLLVTDADILMTGLRETWMSSGPPVPAAPAEQVPGLRSVDAVRNRLVLTFADGSTAMYQLREPTRGAAARVVAWAAPVLRERHEPPARQDA
jgi:hypothetical protein